MEIPEFVKCPGCGQENITTPGETAIHSKGCPFVGTLPETWEQVVPASDPTEVKATEPPTWFIVVSALTLLCLGALVGAAIGEDLGKKEGREEEQKNSELYKSLDNQCRDREHAMQDAWVKQLELTNSCLEALAAQGTEANMRAFRKAQALGIIPKDINPEDLTAPPHVNP